MENGPYALNIFAAPGFFLGSRRPSLGVGERGVWRQHVF